MEITMVIFIIYKWWNIKDLIKTSVEFYVKRNNQKIKAGMIYANKKTEQ